MLHICLMFSIFACILNSYEMRNSIHVRLSEDQMEYVRQRGEAAGVSAPTVMRAALIHLMSSDATTH